MKVMNDKASPRVTIIHHPDVRRSLMVQKSYSEGMRALVLYTASIQDEIELAIPSQRTSLEVGAKPPRPGTFHWPKQLLNEHERQQGNG